MSLTFTVRVLSPLLLYAHSVSDRRVTRLSGRALESKVKVIAEPISKLNTVVSADGRKAKLTVVVRTGQHLPFAVPYEQVGLLIQSLQQTAATMRQRLFGSPNQEAVACDLLAHPMSVSGIALAEDATTGDALLLVETDESGAFPLRLPPEMLAGLRDALRTTNPPSASEARTAA
jgi:hypothetical protein